MYNMVYGKGPDLSASLQPSTSVSTPQLHHTWKQSKQRWLRHNFVQVLVNLFMLLELAVLWCCWLSGRKGIQPVKNWVVRCWCGYLSADLHMAQLMPLPLTVPCFSKIQMGFTFLIPAHPGSPEKRSVKRVCVCVRVCELAYDKIYDNV